MDGLINLISQLVTMFSEAIGSIIQSTPLAYMDFLSNSFNIYLFSDTGWFTHPIPLIELFTFSIILFILIFIIRLLWKGTKKFIRLVLGVFRL